MSYYIITIAIITIEIPLIPFTGYTSPKAGCLYQVFIKTKKSPFFVLGNIS